MYMKNSHHAIVDITEKVAKMAENFMSKTKSWSVNLEKHLKGKAGD